MPGSQQECLLIRPLLLALQSQCRQAPCEMGSVLHVLMQDVRKAPSWHLGGVHAASVSSQGIRAHGIILAYVHVINYVVTKHVW